MNHGRIEVAHHRPGAGGQDGRHAPAVVSKETVTNRVDAPVHAVQAAALDPVVY